MPVEGREEDEEDDDDDEEEEEELLSVLRVDADACRALARRLRLLGMVWRVCGVSSTSGSAYICAHPVPSPHPLN